MKRHFYFVFILIVIIALGSSIITCEKTDIVSGGSNIPSRVSVQKPNSFVITRSSKAGTRATCSKYAQGFSDLKKVAFRIQQNQTLIEFFLGLAGAMTESQKADARSTTGITLTYNTSSNSIPAVGVDTNYATCPGTFDVISAQSFSFNLKWVTNSSGYDTLTYTFTDDLFIEEGNDWDKILPELVIEFSQDKLSNGTNEGNATFVYNGGYYVKDCESYSTGGFTNKFKFNVDTNGIGSGYEYFDESFAFGETYSEKAYLFVESDDTVSSSGVRASYVNKLITATSSNEDSITYKITGYFDNNGGSIAGGYLENYSDTSGSRSNSSMDYVELFSELGCEEKTYYEEEGKYGWYDGVSLTNIVFNTNDSPYFPFSEPEDLYSIHQDFTGLGINIFSDIYGFNNQPVVLTLDLEHPGVGSGIMHVAVLQSSNLINETIPLDQSNYISKFYSSDYTVAFENEAWDIYGTNTSSTLKFLVEDNMRTFVFAYWYTNFDYYDTNNYIILPSVAEQTNYITEFMTSGDTTATLSNSLWGTF